MKISTPLQLLLTGVILSLAGTGCRKDMDRTKPLPYTAANVPQIKDPPAPPLPPLVPPAPPIPLVPPVDTLPPSGVPQTGARVIEGRPQDRTLWADKTIRFAYDSALVKASEGSKIEAVATAFKGMDNAKDLLVEGHCDERGTEEYNRALGERRALAMREYLIRLGLPSDRVHTKTFGKDQPVDTGHNEAAWSKNRRGEFILIK